MKTMTRRKVRGASRSKLVWLGLAVAIAGFLESQFRLVENLIPERWRGVAMMAVGLTVVVLRFMTTLPLEDLAPEAEEPAPTEPEAP